MIYGQRNLGITSHSVEITEIYSHIFWQSFHESNWFTEEVSKKLMLQKNFSEFFHTVDQKIALVVHQRTGILFSACKTFQFSVWSNTFEVRVKQFWLFYKNFRVFHSIRSGNTVNLKFLENLFIFQNGATSC